MRTGSLTRFLICGSLAVLGLSRELMADPPAVVREAQPLEGGDPVLKDDGYYLVEPNNYNDNAWQGHSYDSYYDGSSCGAPVVGGLSCGAESDSCGIEPNFCESEICPECIAPCVSRWDFLAEATLFRYYRGDGMRVGDDAPGNDVTDLALRGAPRLSLTYNRNDCWGLRARWWDYNANLIPVSGGPSFMGVDASTFDIELVRRLTWDCDWDFVFSGGVRQVTFQETLSDQNGDNELGIHRFAGYGGVAAIEAYRHTWAGDLFGRVRGAVIGDDLFRQARVSGPQVLPSTTTGMTEFAVGYRYFRPLCNGMMLYGEVAGEYQTWYSFSSNFDPAAADPESVWTGNSDVGFFGLTLAAGLMF